MNPLAKVQARTSVFALIATWLGRGSQDIPGQWANIPVVNGYRSFTFEGLTLSVANRAPGDELLNDAVNVYFGEDTADVRNVQPQIYHLPVMVHVCLPWNDNKNVAESQAQRLAGLIEAAFENLGARVPLFDFTVSPPAPVVRRFVTWVHRTRGSWREAGDPFKGVYTNLIWTRELRYTD